MATDAAHDREALLHTLERERRARLEAERLLESKSQDLFSANQRLAELAESLAARERYATAIFHSAQDGIIVATTAGLIESANPAAMRLLETDSGTLAGSHLARWIQIPTIPSDVDGAAEAIAMALQRRPLSECTALTSGGRDIPVRIAVGLTEDHDDQRLILVVHDLSEEKATEEALLKTALLDLLTGLGNRAALTAAFPDSGAGSTTGDLCVVAVDLLRFHRINDALGRTVGDETLREMGSRLRSASREALDSDPRLSEWIPIRLGSDEFAILVRGADILEVIPREIERITQALEQPVIFEGYTVPLEICLGYSIGSLTDDDVDALVDRAVIALETAKSRAGQRIAAYDPRMGAERSRVVHLEARIREAIDAGEFVTYFQPRVDVTTGLIVACEALVRWEHPTRGLVLPGEFLPVAEQSSLILDLGCVVLSNVLSLQRRCLELGTARPISVNISHQEFALRSVMEAIQTRVLEAGIPPDLIEFELQESIVADDLDYSREILDAISARGFRIAMDDFGTGQSSLGRLRELPIDVLKIDRSFVSKAIEDLPSERILTAMVSLAEVLGATVVVEGVESESQLAIVSRAGRCEVQGFLYSPAVPASAYEDMLATQPWKRGQA